MIRKGAISRNLSGIYSMQNHFRLGREVVFQCRDEGLLRARVRWIRGNGLPLPPGSRDINGRLEIPNIQLDHSGTYICEAVGYPPSTPGRQVTVILNVEKCMFFYPASPIYNYQRICLLIRYNRKS